MCAIQLSGLETGIDTAAMIKQLIQAESGPLTQLQAKQKTQNDRSSAYDLITNKIKDLQTAVAKLSDAAALRSYTVTSSNTDSITVDVTNNASEGSHEVIVERLATAQRNVQAGLAAKDTLVGAGTFSYTYNNVTRTINTTDKTTLQGLNDLINKDAGNPGITASLLEYTAGGDQNFHLVISGNDSGADYAITINDDQTTLNGSNGTVDFRSSTFTTTQQAVNSRLRVDGYPSEAWIERSSNTVDDVISGVTLHLHSAGTTQVSLTRDTAALKQNVQSWVTSYNAMVDLLQKETAYDSASKTAGPLIGDYTVTAIRESLRSGFGGTAQGFKAGTDAFTMAGEMGITVDRTGKLVLDNTKLDEALSKDYLGVLSLLGASRAGASDSDYIQFYADTTKTKPGSYDVQTTFDAAGVLVSARIKLTSEGDGAWRDALVDGNAIVGAESGPERGLQLTAVWDGSSTNQTAQVRIKQGVAGQMSDTLDTILDASKGLLKIAKDQIATSNATIQKNIDTQNARLDKMNTDLQLKFAKLEATMTQLRAQMAALTQSTTTSA